MIRKIRAWFRSLPEGLTDDSRRHIAKGPLRTPPRAWDTEAVGYPKPGAVVNTAGREGEMTTFRTSYGEPPVAVQGSCDPEITDLCLALNRSGIVTKSSCSGHGFVPGYISLADGRMLMVLDNREDLVRAMNRYTHTSNGERKGDLMRRPGPIVRRHVGDMPPHALLDWFQD